ncbi:unnamed protein product, partial [Prorocentrum cordatum]
NAGPGRGTLKAPFGASRGPTGAMECPGRALLFTPHVCRSPSISIRRKVDVTCDDCGADGVAMCGADPAEHRCMQPCQRKMRCGHLCTGKCGEPCNRYLEDCRICSEIRRVAAEERRAEFQDEIKRLTREDMFSINMASDTDHDRVEHLLRSYFLAACHKIEKVQVEKIISTVNRRRLLLASQACVAPGDFEYRALVLTSDEECRRVAQDGFVDTVPMWRKALQDAASRRSGYVSVLVCQVQLGREYLCDAQDRKPQELPPEGFDSTYDPREQCHRVFKDFGRVCPVFIARAFLAEAEVEVLPELPTHWTASAMPREGWRVVPMPTESAEFRCLQQALKTDPRELGKGRDVKEGSSKYSQLKLVRAWRVEHPPLWRRYATERHTIAEQIRQCKLEIKNPRIRRELWGALKGLPQELQKNVNEAHLLHGTSPDIVLQLLSNGPNERFSTVAMFGNGNYFAEDAAKTDQYVRCDPSYCRKHAGVLHELHKRLYSTSNSHPGSVYYVFVCRVVLGCFVANEKPGIGEWEGIYASPAAKELAVVPRVTPPVHYHSLVADVRDLRFREFVQFHDTRIFPEYLLAYQRAR